MCDVATLSTIHPAHGLSSMVSMAPPHPLRSALHSYLIDQLSQPETIALETNAILARTVTFAKITLAVLEHFSVYLEGAFRNLLLLKYIIILV